MHRQVFARPRSQARRARRIAILTLAGAAVLCSGWAGCVKMARQTDQDVGKLIRQRQQRTLGGTSHAEIHRPREIPQPGKAAYDKNPRPMLSEVPAAFYTPATQPAGADAAGESVTTPPTDDMPAEPPSRGQLFTLTDALGYAQQHQRAFASAKEELYLAALSLTLERHLWTPIFSSSIRTVYGNYGEGRNFDQAMRFVADLGVTQRLPFGGEFTANAIGTLIRDVKKSITASEGGSAEVGVRIPFLRGAGHVARETLIQLERELTYAVRVYERFRREQLVGVSQEYFNLLRAKQAVLDSEESLRRAIDDFDRARAIEVTGEGSPLDTQRAEQRMLAAENDLQGQREDFRTSADELKLLIGMPIDEPLAMQDLEDIETIERQSAAGVYPLLVEPQAARDEELAIAVALERRFDLLTFRDRVDDARRGVEISRNALLPNLDLQTTLSINTPEERYNISRYNWDDATWRSELVFELPLERYAERNAFRRALIGVRAAERSLVELSERVRLEVRRVLNRLHLQARLLEIQQRNVEVAERRREFADIQFEEGKISNRDKVEAEAEWTAARNALNQAKTARWTLLLQFRLVTETLEIEENGEQTPTPELP